MITINSISNLTGKQIKQIREASGLSQRKFVSAIGISRGKLWRCETHNTPLTSRESAAISNWAIHNGYAVRATLWQRIKNYFSK